MSHYQSFPPEYLQQEVLRRYGVEVPLVTIEVILEMDPYVTPDTIMQYLPQFEVHNPESTEEEGNKFNLWTTVAGCAVFLIVYLIGLLS